MNVVTDKDQKSGTESLVEQKTESNRIRSVIAVMSGKGGVGKSFVTGLLASGLARNGYQVGILDADITGPSIPMLFGLHGPVAVGESGMLPLHSRLGIKVMSMNLLLGSEDQAVIWRGPLISKVIKQMWEGVTWGELDYLLVDLPPGTSDAALTIMQSLPVKGVIMVTTPQGLATMIVNKAVHMAQTVGVPILGVVENMTYYRCPDTGKKHFIFGQCHGESVAETAQAPLLAQIPLDPFVAELSDSGKVEGVRLAESSALIETFVNLVPVPGVKKPYREAASPTENKEEAVIRENPTNNAVQHAGHSEAAKKPAGRKSFSEKARRLIESKENLGCFEKPDASGKFKGWCGDSMKIDLRLSDRTILEARFMTDGCGATIACGSMITKMVRSRTFDEVMQITPDDLLTALDGLPEDHEHCAELAVKTLREAVNNAVESQENGMRKGST